MCNRQIYGSRDNDAILKTDLLNCSCAMYSLKHKMLLVGFCCISCHILIVFAFFMIYHLYRNRSQWVSHLYFFATLNNERNSSYLQLSRRLNSFPNKPWFLRVWRTSLLKTLWEKKKLLVTSNFFFSHSVFFPFVEISAVFIKFEIVVCKLLQFGPVQNLSFGKGLMAKCWSWGFYIPKVYP